MLKRLDNLVDRSCWISGDRINACIAVEAHGIAEIGFHGAQPVSRNSRMLVRDGGVLSLSIRDENGREEPVRFETVEWSPHRVSVELSPWGRSMHLEILATDRVIQISVTGEVHGCYLKSMFFSEACTTMVRGERVWATPRVLDGWLTLQCHDRIRLADWIKQKGPYAGDFLIPESWRRTIFSRTVRSGLATAADLKPEYRDADIPIYDAGTWIRIGAELCKVEQNVHDIQFLTPLAESTSPDPALIISCVEHDQHKVLSGAGQKGLAQRTRVAHEELAMLAPRLAGETIPELVECFSTVPGIVRSCTVREMGMTRATPGAYYWIWAWDNMVTGAESLRWGDYTLVSEMTRFITTHRDVNGSIPARWTRSSQPLDTPPHGAMEFLLLQLVYQHALETGERQRLLDVYPYAVALLHQCVALSGGTGFVRNISFYPDHPARFGRTDRSVVALEAGCLYGLVRILENVAILLNDDHVRETSRTLARKLEAGFLNAFWDDGRKFLVDSFDGETGERNTTYPLFSLLFLQTPLGLSLIRKVLPEMAGFMEQHLQSDSGTQMLPPWDIRRGSEEAVASWYPHWDLYLLKVLRRSGRSDGIMRWVHAAGETLRRLGYVPEFLMLDGLSQTNPETWRRHGSVSNVNCLTGWYHGILEGLLGLEFDPGGMGIVPLGLPLGRLTLRGLVHRGSRWDILVAQEGEHLAEMRIDGELLRGSTKVPARYHDTRSHELTVKYGPAPDELRFREILNAEVLESEGGTHSCAVRIRALGTVDIVVDQADTVHCAVDGKPVAMSIDPDSGIGTWQVVSSHIHVFTIHRKS